MADRPGAQARRRAGPIGEGQPGTGSLGAGSLRTTDPDWPPRAGMKVAVYVSDSRDPQRQYLVELEDLDGPALTVRAPAGIDVEAAGQFVKVLFPGRRHGWGYDTRLVACEPGLWRLAVERGPVPVERRDSERTAHRQIVVVRVDDRTVPAHLLDRSTHGMRCVAGRGAPILLGSRVTVEVDPESGDVVRGGVVVWRRLASYGLEFGVMF